MARSYSDTYMGGNSRAHLGDNISSHVAIGHAAFNMSVASPDLCQPQRSLRFWPGILRYDEEEYVARPQVEQDLDAKCKHGGVVVVHGYSGTGKSILCERFAKKSKAR